MHKRYLLLAVALCITALLFLSVGAKTEQSVDAVRLQQASNFIVSKQYKHGYLSFKRMAKHGCPYSQCILGIMNQIGLGVEKSAIRAKYWFQKSARQGFADAEHRLGLMYYHGDGIKKNLVLARQWLTKAASHGVTEAEELLAEIPENTNVYNKMAQAHQQIIGTATNMQKSWQGYSEIVKQLNQLSSAAPNH